MRILDESFYRRDSLEVAKDLLGKVMIREEGKECYHFKIVETEAYRGITDKGAHVYGDKKTERTKPLYEGGGTLYVYLIYGMYHCLNIATGKEGVPHCVLIRAVQPLDEASLAYARANRSIQSRKERDLTNGPGKLCQALHIDRSFNYQKVTQKGALWITSDFFRKAQETIETVATKRINIAYAQEDQEKPWRFYIKGNPFVSVIEK